MILLSSYQIARLVSVRLNIITSIIEEESITNPKYATRVFKSIDNELYSVSYNGLLVILNKINSKKSNKILNELLYKLPINDDHIVYTIIKEFDNYNLPPQIFGNMLMLVDKFVLLGTARHQNKVANIIKHLIIRDRKLTKIQLIKSAKEVYQLMLEEYVKKNIDYYVTLRNKLKGVK